jgi:peptidoglycan/xylan/chitin deacetylase (PgdA/CDA1 family)
VLETLKRYEAKATFFCIGENIEKHPEVYKQLLAEGHRTGNHTFNHLNGWRTNTDVYIQNILKAEEMMSLHQPQNSAQPGKKLFRPPYGKITPVQARKLLHLNYEIIMWDAVSGDFDQSISPEECYQNVINNTRQGSIVVFHDSLKASGNLQLCLPRVLEYFREKGYEFRTI